MPDNKKEPNKNIGAEYASPGPSYMLPTLLGKVHHDPRSEHACGPAYAFGKRTDNGSAGCGPGPCYYPDSKMSRTGRDGNPRHTITGRKKDLTTFATPGPALGLDAIDGSKGVGGPRPPAYSFGGRHEIKSSHTTPGPNCYILPSTVGRVVQSNHRQAPSFSVKSRNKPDKLQGSPGPGAYKAVNPDQYNSAPPRYSMTAKNAPPGDNTTKPGPGSHSPEKVELNKTAPPRYSFGVRHSPYAVSLVVPVK